MTINWWTLGFQTVNVAVLIWLLGHFFWKPVSGMIEARRASTKKLTDDADAAQAKAAAATADVEKTREGFARERDAVLADAHRAADAAAALLMSKAKADAEAFRTEAKAAIAKDEHAQGEAWGQRSTALAIDVAGRLAARLDGDAVQTRFLDWLVDAIRALPEPARKAAGAADAKLELTSAVPLDPAARTSCGKTISDALGGAPQIAFRTDAGLIAGYELRGKHVLVSSSWRADLATVQADLAK